MDDDALVDFSVRDGVGWITLTKGDSGNAFGTPMGVELLAAVMAAEEADVPVLVVSATGRFFCVGGDLREFGAEDEPALLIDELAHMLNRIVSRLKSLDAVVISAVQGGAAGAGLGLAAAADLVIAAESASFTLAYTKAGLSPDGGGTLLAESVGLHRALALALLNPVWSAAGRAGRRAGHPGGARRRAPRPGHGSGRQARPRLAHGAGGDQAPHPR